MKNFKDITLEMSFKPFKSLEQDYIERVCREAFDQWRELLRHTDMVSILLWTSDGSEILEYKGNPDETFEWARYIGGANPRMGWDKATDPDRRNLHARNYLYMENPPVITYGIYKEIIQTLKKVGKEITGKPIRVGATFDPGPEFAKSDFKYNRHNEICIGESMGKSSMVCCYELLKKDTVSYAGFPEGIEEGTPFGTFFGRQSQIFLRDMGFDYLWLSNGFGFGTETWGMIGATFDKERFYPEKMEEVQDKILEFWRLFRRECDIRVETRGTNMTLGIDLASDGVNLQKIYNGGFNILPPCNSPWAAINGDYGIELAGYLSRMAELTEEEEYMYRFYVHDPWWMNSPWLDRYERQPHDIYLPLATARIDKKGDISLPSHLNFLTIDNSLGELKRNCPNEIIPHVLEAMNTAPDASAPFVWVYPFQEYSKISSGRAGKSFFEDMFIRGAINHGFPLSMVVSTHNFIQTFRVKPELYMGSVLTLPMPVKGDEINDAIITFLEIGGKVLLYGSIQGADEKLLKILNLTQTISLTGKMKVAGQISQDEHQDNIYPDVLEVKEVLSDGGIDTVLFNAEDKNTEILIGVKKQDKERVAGIYRQDKVWQGGAVIWLRGTNGGEFHSGANVSEYDVSKIFCMEAMVRYALSKFDFTIGYIKKVHKSKDPVTMISRHENAFYLSGYSPDSTVGIKLKFPLGAPLLLGSETYIDNKCAVYHMPRAWHKECRVFVEQNNSEIISCKDIAPASYFMYRRIEIKGLKDAVVRIFPRTGFEEKTEILLNPVGPYIVGEPHEEKIVKTKWGTVIELKHVTGTIILSDRHVEYETVTK